MSFGEVQGGVVVLHICISVASIITLIEGYWSRNTLDIHMTEPPLYMAIMTPVCRYMKLIHTMVTHESAVTHQNDMVTSILSTDEPIPEKLFKRW